MLAEKRSIEIITKNQNLDNTLKQIETFQKQTDEIETRLTEIQKAINDIKDSVLKNCRVVAATSTQTYLKHKSFEIDIVVIDESSMLPLPVVAYVSGLAKEKVTVTGDFKQLPPIVSATRDPSVMKWIAMIFLINQELKKLYP